MSPRTPAVSPDPPPPEGVVASSLPSLDAEGPELRAYVRLLLANRWLILATLGFALGAATFYVKTTPPIYRAGALVLIERTGPHVLDIQGADGQSVQLAESKDYYKTQYEILASRTLASRVLETLEIDRAERFRGNGNLARAWLGSLLSSAEPEPEPGSVDRNPLIGSYLSSLSIRPISGSRLVRVEFESIDPELAAQIANEHAQAYIRQGLTLRAQANRDVGALLRASIDDIETRVEEARRALNEFRRSHDIVAIDERADIITANLEDMNQRLVQAEAERIARETDMQMVRERRYESLPAVINNELIRRLKQELAPMQREYAAMRPAVTEEYSGMRAIRARMEDAQHRIDVETQHIVEGIESDYLAAQRRERELRREVERRKEQALALKDDAVEYALLQQNVDAAMSLYESVRQRTEETGMVADLPASNVSVIDAAYAPRSPSAPRGGSILVLSGLIGLMGGAGLALLRAALDNRLRTAQDVERSLHLPTLGLVPCFDSVPTGFRRLLPASLSALPRLNGRPSSTRPVLAQVPPEPVCEAYRSIRTDLLLSQAGQPPQCMLFSSAVEGEGKTTTALNTAVLFAQLGEPVLLIDADLRKPRCHQLLGTPRTPGLTEALTGQQPQLHERSILDHPLTFLPSGARPPNPTELLGSQRMAELLHKLRERFAYILIDGPPVVALSDSLVLSPHVDGVVLVADRERTQRQLACAARSRFAFANAKLIGVVLNRVDPSENDYYRTRAQAYAS